MLNQLKLTKINTVEYTLKGFFFYSMENNVTNYQFQVTNLFPDKFTTRPTPYDQPTVYTLARIMRRDRVHSY